MTERYIDFSEFDQRPLSDALTTHAEDARDVAFGAGNHMSLAEGKASLEVFPASGVARVTTEDSRIELFRVPGVSVDIEKSRVVFEQGLADERTRLMIRSDGKVSYHPVVRAAETAVPQHPETTDAKTVDAAIPAPAPTTAPERPAATASPETSETPLVTLQGRLGRDPWFSNKDDSPIGGFPLAVSAEDKTIWHKVVVFDDAAAALAEQHREGDVRKGRLVDVTGQLVLQEEQTPRGVKRRTEFHATQVIRVRATRVR